MKGKLYFVIVCLTMALFAFILIACGNIENPNSQNVEPEWLPVSLGGLHPHDGIWSRKHSSSENVYHTNFTSAKDFVDELVGVIHPGYIGIENAISSNYGAAYSYFQSAHIKPENAEDICNTAKTYADEFYLELLTLRDYLNFRDDILYSFLFADNSMDADVYKPYSTVSQVSSHLWVYEMSNVFSGSAVCVSAYGTVKHGNAENIYLKIAITINAEQLIGYKSGYIYTFTPDDGSAPVEYDLRTITYIS